MLCFQLIGVKSDVMFSQLLLYCDDLFAGKRKISSRCRGGRLNFTMHINLADGSTPKLSKTDESVCSKVRVNARV